ncbi:MAG: heavy metal sensor histidine kinase [Rubrivivax sp.]|nr:heavy metal sensor histidine kinase [Rubrivivax sp.]
MPSDPGRRRPRSLALRITLVVSVTMAVVFSASAWLVSRSIESHFEQLDFDELLAVRESLGRALGDEARLEDPEGLRDRLARAVAGHHGVFFGVVDAAGRAVYVSAPPALLELARRAEPSPVLDRRALRAWADGPHVYRGSVLPDAAGGKVFVAVATDAHARYLALLRRGLWWGVVAATSLAVLAVCIAVRWGHAPIRRMSATVRGITSEHLHTRLDPLTVPVELATLVSAFNAMLDQLQGSFERLAHFSADIAHELRTPVTNLLTQTQVALARDRPAAAYREVLYAGLDELDRLRKMIGDMLFLAQTEDPRRRLQKGEADLEAETRAVFDFFEALSEEAGVALRFEAGPAERPPLRIDRGMLQRALTNLVGNAIRHTPRGEAVTVRGVDEGRTMRIEVENPGATIGPEHVPHLFERFYRIDPSRHRAGDGAGLGLAIVRAIAEAHGGAVGVRSEAGSNSFWLRLPVD